MKLLPLLALLFICARPHPLKRITNGQDAERNQFPYQVSIRLTLAGITINACGGSIISPTWILTAGSCDLGIPVTLKVAAAILDVDEQGEEREVVDFIVHPDFEGDLAPHDIALLKLDQPLTFSESIQPVALPEPGTIPQGEAVISGWGEGSILQYAQVPIITYDECANTLTELLGTSEDLYEGEICTGSSTEGISVCTGDGGGPLVQEGVVVGVISWGIVPCGYPEAPSVYTRVSDYLDFILEHVDDLPGKK